MKKNKRIDTPNMVFGINSCLNLFKAKKLQIISIHIMIDGNADKNRTCSDFLTKNFKQIQKLITF